MTIKVYCTDGYAGLVQTRTSRETGLPVSVWRNDQARLDDDDGRAPWSTTCDRHSFIVCHPSLALALRHATNPTGWCEQCSGMIDWQP